MENNIIDSAYDNKKMIINQLDILSGKNLEIELPEDIFGIPQDEINLPLLSVYVRYQKVNNMAGTKAVKGLSEVAGTGKKPWRQKGTGRARAGTTNRPQDRGGARAHDVATVHDLKLNKKIKRSALKHALSYKHSVNAIYFVDNLDSIGTKTKDLYNILKQHNLESSLIIDTLVPINVTRSSANLPYVNCLPVIGLNVYSLLRYENVIITKSAIKAINDRLNFESSYLPVVQAASASA